jgi:hypothetical protein
MNKLPPLNAPKSDENEDTVASSTANSNARQRRRARLQQQISANQQSEQNKIPSRSASKENLKSAVNKKEGAVNGAFESENEPVQPTANTTARRPRRSRNASNTATDSVVTDELTSNSLAAKRRERQKQGKSKAIEFKTVGGILAGFEEDIVEMDEQKAQKMSQGDEEYETNKESQRSTDKEDHSSQRELLGVKENDANALKSVNTDKFYLELEKKFIAQRKQEYEKREEERRLQIFAAQLKQQEKEEQKYEISTPKTALYTHSFLRVLFLIFHGLNVGFQCWQALVVYLLHLSDFALNDFDNSQSKPDIIKSFSLILLFKNLVQPIHCVSYLILTVCIVDAMDRIELSKMKNLRFLVKCISFQNQFWSIILYACALVISLAFISFEDSVFLNLYLEPEKGEFNSTSGATFLNNMNQVCFFYSFLYFIFDSFTYIDYLSLVFKLKECRSLERVEYWTSRIFPACMGFILHIYTQRRDLQLVRET